MNKKKITILKKIEAKQLNVRTNLIKFDPINSGNDRNDIIFESNHNFEEVLKEAKKYFLKAEYDKSLDLLKSIYGENQNSTEINYYLGLIYSKKKIFDSAMRFLNRVLELFNQQEKIQESNTILIHTKFILAYIYILGKEINKAEDLIQKYQNYHFQSQNIFYLNILGYIYFLKKDFSKSEHFYRRLIKIDQNNATAYNMLGYIHIEKDHKEIDKAIDFYQKALKINPNHSYYLDSLGLAFHLKKNELKAIQYLKLAYEKDPMNQEIKDNLENLLSSH